MNSTNPFSLVRASDFTDEQINSLWVEIGPKAINNIIEPTSKVTKFILGGKGSGKTHLLRYYSYPVIRLREGETSGLETVSKHGFLAVFLRATGLDSTRFEAAASAAPSWQQLFGIYLELRLLEIILDALIDIRRTSDAGFSDENFMRVISSQILTQDFSCTTLEEFRYWTVSQRKTIDFAINNVAFSGTLNVTIPFSIGSICFSIGKAISSWCGAISSIPIIYMIDEIENFTGSQQQVLNSLIRYAEGTVSFRITGRLYSIKTYSTLMNGEENREGSEFKLVQLDDFLRLNKEFSKFAKRFAEKRLNSAGLLSETPMTNKSLFDPERCFDSISNADYFEKSLRDLKVNFNCNDMRSHFIDKMLESPELKSRERCETIASMLTDDLPIVLQKLNILLFIKQYKFELEPEEIAEKIFESAKLHQSGCRDGPYARAYGHWSSDLFAQVCRNSINIRSIPYAGWDAFVKMSSGNVRSLLIILGRIYAASDFRGINFISEKLPVSLQSEAVVEAARFMFESDSNYGTDTEQAREVTSRLAELLRTARYSINIPEVSPAVVTFSDSDLLPESREALNNALKYSLIFEIRSGRPDRNNQRVNRKIQLNPLLSPKWGLPISRRGDISLSQDVLNSVFKPESREEFSRQLNRLHLKWDHPFRQGKAPTLQRTLF